MGSQRERHNDGGDPNQDLGGKNPQNAIERAAGARMIQQILTNHSIRDSTAGDSIEPTKERLQRPQCSGCPVT